MISAAPIQAIRKYATRWGVPVLKTRPSRHISSGPGPWSIATWRRNPRIFSDDAMADPNISNVFWAYLLHELAHAACPMHPEHADEFVDTLGFEVLSIAHLGLPHEEYLDWFSTTWGPLREPPLHGLDEAVGRTWIQVPAEVRVRVETQAKVRAVERGLFDAAGEPTYRIARLRGRA